MKRFKLLALLCCFVLCIGCTSVTPTEESPSETPPEDTATPPEDAGPSFAPSSPTVPTEPSDSPTPDTDPTPEELPFAPWTANDIVLSELSYANTFKHGGVEVLKVSAVFPQTGVQGVDSYYANCCDDFQRSSQSMLKDAEAYSGDLMFATFTLDTGYTIELNASGLISVSRQTSRFMGGAHGETLIACETFRLDSGTLLTLDDFFTAERTTYTERLLAVIEGLIAATPDRYYPDAMEIARAFFPYDSFCVTKSGLSIFFPEYNIASFTEHVVRFDIPWSEIADIVILPS